MQNLRVSGKLGIQQFGIVSESDGQEVFKDKNRRYREYSDEILGPRTGKERLVRRQLRGVRENDSNCNLDIDVRGSGRLGERRDNENKWQLTETTRSMSFFSRILPDCHDESIVGETTV